jgi:hypothetical protein
MFTSGKNISHSLKTDELFTLQGSQTVSVIKANCLLVCREIIALYSENCTKQINTFCIKMQEFLVTKICVCTKN